LAFDVFFLHHPSHHLGCAVGGVANQSFWSYAKPDLYAMNHNFRGINFGIADRRGRRNIHDDRVLYVDQIIGRPAKEGRLANRRS
jgi:hypothetical protein